MFKLMILTLIMILSSFGFKKHPLTLLLSLEIMSLLIIIVSLILGIDLFHGLLMICIGACEGAVGLRTLIGNSRVGGVSICLA